MLNCSGVRLLLSWQGLQSDAVCCTWIGRAAFWACPGLLVRLNSRAPLCETVSATPISCEDLDLVRLLGNQTHIWTALNASFRLNTTQIRMLLRLSRKHRHGVPSDSSDRHVVSTIIAASATHLAIPIDSHGRKRDFFFDLLSCFPWELLCLHCFI